MKKTAYPVLATAGLCLFATMCLQAQTILFSDSFDRPDNRNIDGSLTGIVDNTGSALAVDGVYSQPHVDPVYESTGSVDGDPSNGGGADITNGVLRLAVGAGTSCAFINHNFVNAAILSEGGFTVSMDVTAYPGGARQNGGGFAIGMSASEAASAGDAFNISNPCMTGAYNGDPYGVTGNPVAPGVIVSDFWIGIRGNNSLAWGSSTGNVLGVPAGGLTNKTGTISVNFSVDNFTAGSTVDYEVFYNGVSQGFGSFQWSGNNENYIGLDARDGTAVSIDDLSISTTNVNFNTEVDLAITPDIVGEDTVSTGVELTFSTFNLPPGATYAIVADKAVTYPFGGDTGSAESPFLPIEAEVDGTLGDVTFTIYISNSVPALVASDSVTVTAVQEAPALLSTLFSDNYNRLTFTDADYDIDSSSTGMGGSLAPLVYLETYEKGNISTTNWDDTSTLINIDVSGLEEVCSMANGFGMAMWGLDHNFTDGSILTGGGFSVAMDILQINQDPPNDDAADRYSGFGVGLTLAEINAFNDENSGDLQGPRGAVAGGTRHSGLSDFHTSVSLNNQLQVFADGLLVGQFPLATNVGRLRADFGVTNFNAGSFVAYQVYFDGLLRTEGFFRWQQDNQNYMAVSSRATVFVDLDNLEIGTVNVPFTAPAEHPDLVAQVTGLTPATPPFDSMNVDFNSVAGVAYRADIAASLTNEFAIAPGPVGGEAVVTATNSTTSATVDLPGGFEDSGFLQISPVHWPGPIAP